jgi:putative RecB family exonuclease
MAERGAQQGALPLGAAAQPLLRATPSRLSAYADCPRRYRMTYLDRPSPPRGPAWAHNTVGAAVHLALARWWGRDRRERTGAAAAHLLETAWQHDGFRSADHSAQWRDTARDWVETYSATLDPDDEPAGVERTVGARTRALALSGRIDRLDDRDGTLVVVDYKTGRFEQTDDDARTSQALALYAYAAGATLRRSCVRVELHGIRTGTVGVHEHTAESLARQVRRADDIGDDIRTASAALADGGDPEALFPPVTGPLCGWCDLRASCPEGRQASEARAPWEGLG